MFIKAEFFARCGRIGATACALALAATVLAACMASPPQSVQPAAPGPAVSNGSSASGNGNGSLATAPPSSASAAPSPDREPVVRVLAYADRVRSLSAAELNLEVARLGNPYVPASQLQLALALGQLRQTPELIRAQEVLTRLLANPDGEAQVLHPLARLLAARFGEQRRLEDLLDKQTQQTREAQRRLDQTNERLEALKAIERSLNSRPPAPAPSTSAPVSRARIPAP